MYASPIRTAPLIRTGRYGKRSPIPMPDGTKSAANHEGVDARAAVGTPVYPTIGGTVTQTITGYRSPSSPGTSRGRRIFSPGGAGNVVVVRGDDGRDHVYGHLDRVRTVVGARVGLGDVIADSGRTGVTAAHLHYGVWLEFAPNRWRSIDPTLLLPWEGDVLDEFELIDPNRKPDPTTKPALPIPEDDMMKTRKYRQPGRTEVVLVNPATGLLWHIPDRGWLGYVDALGLADEPGEVELPADRFRALLTITSQAHDPERQAATIAALTATPEK